MKTTATPATTEPKRKWRLDSPSKSRVVTADDSRIIVAENMSAEDALLVAAAPDLLEAAKAMLEYLQRQSTPPMGEEMGRLICNLCASVAKAEGSK